MMDGMTDMGYRIFYLNSDSHEDTETLEQAQVKAESFCGNSVSTRLPDGTLIYGFGDGYASVIIRNWHEDL